MYTDNLWYKIPPFNILTVARTFKETQDSQLPVALKLRAQ